jgi:hypothetical protein
VAWAALSVLKPLERWRMRAMMRDRTIIWTGLLVAALAMLACNAFAGRPTLVIPSPPALPAGTPPADAGAPAPGPTNPAGSGFELAPTVTIPGQPTLTGDEPAVVILVDLNIRSGPGVSNRRVGFMLRGERAVVLGRDERTGWWRIVCPPAADGSDCWVSGGERYTRLEAPAAAPTVLAPTLPGESPPAP